MQDAQALKRYFGALIAANPGRIREVLELRQVIEPGIAVRQKQDLFYLPDLSRMEVIAMLHESVVDRVKSGMKARIAFEGAPDVALTGRVTSVAPLPLMDDRSDVRYFEGVVRLDEVPRRALMPGMSGRVVIIAAMMPARYEPSCSA